MSDPFQKFIRDSLKDPSVSHLDDLYNEPSDLTNKTPQVVPPEFNISSKIIIVSDLTEKPLSVDDHTLSVRMDMGETESRADLYAKLENSLSEFTDLSLEDKKKVLDIYHAQKHKSHKITIDQFLAMCIVYKSGDPLMSKWIKAQVRK
jgi:hypothetical protein